MVFHRDWLCLLGAAVFIFSFQALAEKCIETVLPVHQLNSDRYVVSPGADAAMFIVGNGDSFNITSFKTGKVTKLTGIVGSPAWMADGRLMSGQAAGRDARISELLKADKTAQVLTPATGELVDRLDSRQLGRHFFKLEKDQTTGGVNLTTEPGSESVGTSVSVSIPKVDLDQRISVRVKEAQYYFENQKSAKIVASSDQSGKIVMASNYVNGRINELYVVDLNQGTVRQVPMPKISEQELADFKHNINAL